MIWTLKCELCLTQFVLLSFCYSCKIWGRTKHSIECSTCIQPFLSKSETFNQYFCEYLCPGVWGFLFQCCVCCRQWTQLYLLLAQGTSLSFLPKLYIICASLCIGKHFSFLLLKSWHQIYIINTSVKTLCYSFFFLKRFCP